MSTWIALLRGIGGGIRPMPMGELKKLLETGGFRNVRTYIASGNVVFDAGKVGEASLVKRIESCVTKRFGFNAKAIVLSVADLQRAIKNNPFPAAETSPTSVHLFFLAQRPPKPDLARMNELKAPTEQFTLLGNVFYFHTPDGFGKSKLATRIERLLGVDATARNWRTVTKVMEMSQQA